MLLTHRKLMQSKAIAIENDLRATLRNFGLRRCRETTNNRAPQRGRAGCSSRNSPSADAH
jgi:hypothetical protein